MDYIGKIREHVGHDLVMTVGCGVLIEDAEVLEHRFFTRDEIPVNLFPCDSRAILDWAKGTDKVIVD